MTAVAECITKEKWAEIEKNLKGLLGYAFFELNGIKVSVHRKHVSEGRSVLAVYFDSVIKGSWFDASDPTFGPLVIQLWRNKLIKAYPPSQRARIIKSFGVRRAKELFPNLDATKSFYVPTFEKASTLVRQFKKVNGLRYLEMPSSGWIDTGETL